MAELVLFTLGGPFAFHAGSHRQQSDVPLMILMHTMSTHAFTAIKTGSTTSSRISSCPSCVTLDLAPVQDQHIRADIYIPQMQVDECRGLCIDASRVRDFHGNAANPSPNGTLRHSDITLVLSFAEVV